MQIRPEQMKELNDAALAKTERDIAEALRKNLATVEDEQLAVKIHAMSEAELADFVHKIVEIGTKYGFMLRGDLYALVEACVRVGPENLLAQEVLEHPRLSPSQKVKVMLDLYKEGLAPPRGPSSK